MRHRHHLAPVLSLMLLASVVSGPGWPYDLDTHRAINDGAVIRSSLNGYLTDVLALEEGIAATFNDRRVRDWIREGGAFEDHPRRRAANHFHYPLRPWDQALLTDFPGSVAAVESSVLWAQNPNQRPFLGPEDPQSWVNARREFFDGLTLTDATEREVAFGHTFRALGQVLHLIADGSVPAHVRNDSHLTGEPIETWLEAQAQRRGTETQEQARARFLATFAPSSVPFSPTVLGMTPNPLAPIPIAKVIDADVYDGTAGTLGLTAGNAVGISEFSNANFFSADTIFADSFIGNERFSPFPSRTNVEKLPDTTNNRQYWRKTGPGVPVDHMATVSRLDFFRQGGAPLTGGLDPVVHDEYARLLIPRAVGYSTGVIDYFFRGRLGAVDPEFTNTGVRLKVKNAIDAEEIPEWANESLYAQDRQGKAGRFVLTVTYKQGEEERLIASKAVSLTVDEFIKPGETSTQILDFPLSPPPADATVIEYRLVFRGRLGEEDDAVAVGLIEPASGFIVRPDYSPDDRIFGSRLIVRSGGRWRLTEDSNLQGGNIDWKGAYVNGRPTKVLSWSGPKSRHFPDAAGDPFGSNIYQNGERFARLGRVLGAAIMKDAAGKEWLVAVSRGSNADIVYRRPNEKSDSFALYDPVTNPTGWQVIGRFLWEADFMFPNRPWFFNGDGTEAQTLREIEIGPVEVDTRGLKTTRLRITLTNAETTSIENLGNLAGYDLMSTATGSQVGAPGICTIIREHSSERTGSYVVAVDYKDKQEILCELRIEAGGSSSTTGIHSSGSGSRTQTYMLNATDNVSEVLACEDLNVDHSLLRRSRTVDMTLTNGVVSGSENLSSEREIHKIDFLDMRHDLIVTSSSGLTSDLSLTPFGDATCPGSICSRLLFDATGKNDFANPERDEIRHRGTVFKTFDFFDPITQSEGGVSMSPPSRGCGNSEITPTKNESKVYPTISLATRTQGSWAVDSNGNLAASQTKGANHRQADGTFGTGEFFNHLTGGNLEQVIQTAPNDARYFPIYVVK